MLFFKLFSFASSYAVDVPLEVAAVNKFSKNILLKGGDGARIEAEFFLIIFQKLFRKYHVADTHGGGKGFRKGVKINHIVVFCENRAFLWGP